MWKPNNRALPPALFIVEGVTQYTGAALAVLLFGVLMPTTVAWWRVSVAAVVLLIWRRPWRQGLRLRGVAVSALFGIVMTGMNMAFYQAIARVDLGIAVSIEFIGPVLVAVLLGRGWVSKFAGVVAFVGVMLVSVFGMDSSRTIGFQGILWALLAGALWAGYIILGRKIASMRSGLTSLSIGLAAGAIVYFPLVAHDFAGAFQSQQTFWMVVGVSILSTVIPYSIDQLVMSWIDAPAFALLNSLLPATSLLVGAVMLQQFPNWVAVLGLVLVSVAVWLSSRRIVPAD